MYIHMYVNNCHDYMTKVAFAILLVPIYTFICLRIFYFSYFFFKIGLCTFQFSGKTFIHEFANDCMFYIYTHNTNISTILYICIQISFICYKTVITQNLRFLHHLLKFQKKLFNNYISRKI